jgi:hypothetical protein
MSSHDGMTILVKISNINNYEDLLRQMKSAKQGVNLFDYSIPYYLYNEAK